MATSKQDLWNSVEKVLVDNKVKANVVEALKDMLAPKSGGGVSTNPPKEIGGMMHYYCRFHQRYEAEIDMVMSQGKSKGYCKSSISKWNKTNSQIKRLESEAVGAICKDNLDRARELSEQANDLKTKLNDPAMFDYEQDWALFNGQANEQ